MKDSQREVLDFWFVETAPVQWFQKNSVFDDMIRERFSSLYDMTKEGFCDGWAKDADGCLSLIIILDQFPRNMFRNTPRAFESDAKALSIARDAISKGFDQVIPQTKRRFIYLPFEHSENIEDQKRSVELFESMKDEDPLGYEYAVRHLRTIEKFGRFPNRNAALGRESTAEEAIYLDEVSIGF